MTDAAARHRNDVAVKCEWHTVSAAITGLRVCCVVAVVLDFQSLPSCACTVSVDARTTATIPKVCAACYVHHSQQTHRRMHRAALPPTFHEVPASSVAEATVVPNDFVFVYGRCAHVQLRVLTRAID